MDNHTTSSLSSQPQNRIEQQPMMFNRLQRTPRILLQNNIITERFNSYGIPLKSGGKSTVVIAIQENRKREKHDLSYLNDRFASYIERVRFLEAQNKKLQLEIDQIRGKCGSQITKIKEMYEVETREAHLIIDDTNKDRATADLRAKRTEEEILTLKDKYASSLVGRDSDRQKIELLQKQISDNEADIDLFRRRLVDLEDEHKHYHTKSQELILDIQHITKELDHETLTRIQLENQKQKLEEEMNILKEIHSEKLEEIKQTSSLNTQLDPTEFFKHELSNAVRNIREEYEQRNYQQRNELESRYRWNVTQILQEIQPHRAIENSGNIREQGEFQKLQTLVSDSRHDIFTLRQRNEQLENRIRELENCIHIERNDNNRASDEHDRQIKDIRARLEDLDTDYDKLITTKSSLNSEITGYRQLLEGDENREGLRQTVKHIKEQALQKFYADRSTNYSYLQSHQKTSTRQGFGNNSLMLTSYVPFQTISSTRIEPTIFEQVYGDDRERPATLGLNFQWIPAVDRSSPYKRNGSDIINRKLKRKTLIETGTVRDHQSRKAITPPSSDYTDAYLSAFAPKPIPTKHIYRLTTPRFANVALIPFVPTRSHLSVDDSLTTNQTYFNNINNTQTSDTIVPSFPNSSFTYPSSFIPDVSTKYESFSSTQSSLPESQTFNSNHLTSSQSSDGTSHTPLQPSPSTYPTADHSERSSENILQPLPPSSVQSHPSSTSSVPPLTTPTCKPSVPFQSAPLSPVNDTDDSSTIKQTVPPSLDTEKQIKRPETLLFRHDEDIRSSSIEKPSSIITPLLDSPMTHVESKVEADRPSTEELSTISSKPLEVLENTITKYDSLIGQISDILASVSPLSSTMSIISPSKSVLDYEFSSNGSPVLQPRRIQSQSSQRTKTKHLIRDDSYDKIITAIADLDNEMTPPPDNRMSSLAEQVTEETNILSFDEHQTPSLLNEKTEGAEIFPKDEQQLPSEVERENDEDLILSIPPPSDILTNEIPSSNETKLEQEKFVDVPSRNETPIDSNEFSQLQTTLLSNVRSDEAITQETNASDGKVASSKKNEKHVTWDETIFSNEDDESSSYQSLTEDSNSSESSKAITEEKRLTSDETTTAVKQHMNTVISGEQVVSDEQLIPPTSIEPSSYFKDQTTSQTTTDEQKNQEEMIESQKNVTEQPIKLSSPLETSSSFSDSLDPQSSSSDLNESRTSHDEQVPSSRNSPLVSTIDSSIKDTLAVDERSTTIADIINEENSVEQVEEAELNKTEITTQLVDNTESETQTLANVSPALSSLPTIVSPIDTLVDAISTRYISSDVYHGYLGEYTQFTESPSEIDTENTGMSLLTSLRQTIATPVTPLIETIQSVVSSMQTTTVTQPSEDENEAIDHNQSEATAVLPDSTEEMNKHTTQTEEDTQIVYASEEYKTILENLSNTANELPDLRSDKQEVLSTSNEEQIEPTNEKFVLTEDMKDLTTLEPALSSREIGSSDVKLVDHLTNESEIRPSSSCDTDVAVSANEDKEQITSNPEPSIADQIEDQENVIVQSLSPEVPVVLPAEDKMIENIIKQHDEDRSIEIVESISSAIVEANPANQKPKDVTIVVETTTENIEPTPIVQDDEQMLITNTVSSERIDTIDKEEITQVESASIVTPAATNSEQKIDESKTSLDDTPGSFGMINESVISSSPTEESHPSTEQDFGPTPDETNTEQILTTETNQLTSDHEIILNIIQKLINDTIQTTTLNLQQNLMPISDSRPTKSLSPRIDDIMQQSLDELESHSISMKTKIENISSKPFIDLRESSPTNTEPDSLELIHALRGHSIALPNSPEQIFHSTEKSSSSTTSSQITSSDRYVSYAIHEMHDSSQDRLPAIPIAADIPIYKKMEENNVLKPMFMVNQTRTKEDDLTECDASDNLTSCSDDILLRRLQPSSANRRIDLDTSSTDDDVDEEFEELDLTNIHQIVDKLTPSSSHLSTNEEGYQLYDLATTSSSNDSSIASKKQPDDVYIIPEYPGLWRPSADNDSTNLPMDYDADDERKTVTKSRTIGSLSESVRRPLTFQHQRDYTTNSPHSEILTSGIPLRPDTIDIFNRPLNKFSFDISESDSYQTCPSSIQKQQKQSELSEITKSEDQTQSSSDESLFLIRERERGVSLPITMNIDYDDIAFRLSTSTPNDAQLWSTIQSNVSSPSTHSQLAAPAKSSPASSPSLSSHENDQRRLSSWLNTVNTVTTTTDGSNGPLESRITFLKSSKGPISISECHPEGHHVIIDNTSRSKNIDLTNWIIHQENDNGDKIIFTFPNNCLLKPNHSLKILSKINESEQRNDDLIATSISSWHIGSNIVTTLVNPEGKDCATLTKQTLCS